MAKEPSVLDELFSEAESINEALENPETFPHPAIRKLGTVECPICDHEVSVLETKKGRPFISCGYCFVRIFYNGVECTKRLRRRMTPVSSEPG